MTSLLAGSSPPATSQDKWRFSGVPPMALLIASSIVLVTVILIVTGLAAGYLREQAIGIAETELARLDAVFAEVADRSLRNGSLTKSQPDSAALPMTELAASYRAAALGEDATVSLLRDDGTVLGQFPAAANLHAISGALRDAVRHRIAATLREPGRDGGRWRIAAVHPIPDAPVSVVLSRGGDEALEDWSQQALLFGVFAVAGTVAIGLMAYLIAGQFRFHNALVVARAESIEAEHARLVAEAELLKKERLSVLGQLTATVAHELRNPLSAIRNTVFTVKEMAASGAMKLERPIARMERSIERCDRIITDLLEYTRTRDLRCSPVGFDQWLQELLAEQAVPAGITLARELHAGDAVARIDAERVRRIFINLIDNAAQALNEQPGNANKRITVRTLADRDTVEFAVADNGPGIAPENRGRIFEPLFSTKNFGTGLGLATVKQIVGEHCGTIGIDSDVGRGTTITVRLPLEPAKAAA
jgi:signal transduction histidine kinase